MSDYSKGEKKPFNSPDSLFSLCFANLWLLISLGHDVAECCTCNSTSKLLGSPGTFLDHLFLLTLLMLPSVEDSPCDFSGVALQCV